MKIPPPALGGPLECFEKDGVAREVAPGEVCECLALGLGNEEVGEEGEEGRLVFPRCAPARRQLFSLCNDTFSGFNPSRPSEQQRGVIVATKSFKN